MSKQLLQSGLELDDQLTERLQKERCTLDADFQTLKEKKLLFRGSVLSYCRNDKACTCVCQKDKADTVPPAA